jgi:hypothetical protein
MRRANEREPTAPVAQPRTISSVGVDGRQKRGARLKEIMRRVAAAQLYTGMESHASAERMLNSDVLPPGRVRPPSAWGSRNAALAALGFNVVVLTPLTLTAAFIDFMPYEAQQTLYDLGQTLEHLSRVGLFVGALGFLPWLKATYARARTVTPSPALEERWRNGVVMPFFIPIANLVRPYYVVSTLNDSIEPDDVPPPQPRLAERGALYREPAPVVASVRQSAKKAPVGLWWTLWCGRLVAMLVTLAAQASNLAVAAQDLVELGAASAACLVVWRISARLDECERRQAALR